MSRKPVDVWNVATFDSDLLAILQASSQLISDHIRTEKQIFLDYEYSRRAQGYKPRPDNPHTAAFLRLKDQVSCEMEHRTIRAWHYTRLTDSEVDDVRRIGIQLSTLDSFQARVAARVAAGEISPSISKTIIQASPLHSEQREARSDKFWMVSHPLRVDDGGVSLLLSNWGGEVAYFWARDASHKATVRSVGSARVLEIAVPMSSTRHAYSAATAVMNTYGRAQGCVADKSCFDLYSVRPLGTGAVLAIHTEGEKEFGELGLTYPPDFVDVSVGYWKELTGEDED